jgi:hypothetical protein
VPMVIAMYYHMFPSEQDAKQMRCTCEWGHSAAQKAA